MRVWAVANQKGGVGKTTTSIALAGLLADAGKRVVVVDLDPHGSMTSYFGHDPDTLEHSCFDLFQHSGGVPSDLPKQLLLQTSHERISLLPSSTALATLERQSPGKSGLGLVIAKSLAQLWQDYDHAVIDSPPLLGVLMVNALAASQQLVIPVQTEFLAVKGLERMINTLAMINRSRQQALPYTIVPTLFDRRTQASMGTLRVLRNTYPEHLWPAYIPVDTRLRDASRAGLVPSNFDSNSRGVIAYRALLKHLLSQQIAAQVA
ncbi:MAG: cobalamin biosynthesis protein CobQ [Pseudomonas sp.]|uniref:ParA family protein n=1 Tax=Pseudomonas sp. Ga0074129 TaxID=1752219 RepID=UPI000A4FD9B9|nr:ParA family protein [Pseudomonas sp. Ga0074129]MBA4287595.1 cobalamin biosynthesis protein CobQ [Pseudomonas sp.]